MAAWQMGHLAALGLSTAAMVIGRMASGPVKEEHLVNLNCWRRGADGWLRTVKIKAEQDKDKT